MYRMLIMIILSLNTIYGRIDDPISIGAISFTSAVWNNVFNTITSDHRISDYTATDRAVVLYLFEACFT